MGASCRLASHAQMPGKPEILIRLQKSSFTAGDSLDGDVLVHLPESDKPGTGMALWSSLKSLREKRRGPAPSLVPTDEFSDDSDEDFDDFEDDPELDDTVTLVDGATRLAGVDNQGSDEQHWSSRVVGVKLDFLGLERTLAVCQYLGFEPEHTWVQKSLHLFESKEHDGADDGSEGGFSYLPLETGRTLAFPFSIPLKAGLPPTHPLPRTLHLFSAGEETITYTLKATAFFRGKFRQHQASETQRVLVMQKPPSSALAGFKEYCQTEACQVTQKQQETKRFWFHKGAAKCEMWLNKEVFFLHPKDTPIAFVSVTNNSTSTMSGLDVRLIVCQFSSFMLQDEDAARSYEELEVPMKAAVTEAWKGAKVMPNESRGFSFPLVIARPRRLPPSIKARILRVQYRVEVTFHFTGVSTSSTLVAPVHFIQAPAWFVTWSSSGKKG